MSFRRVHKVAEFISCRIRLSSRIKKIDRESFRNAAGYRVARPVKCLNGWKPVPTKKTF
jgi:hypothetical protein